MSGVGGALVELGRDAAAAVLRDVPVPIQAYRDSGWLVVRVQETHAWLYGALLVFFCAVLNRICQCSIDLVIHKCLGAVCAWWSGGQSATTPSSAPAPSSTPTPAAPTPDNDLDFHDTNESNLPMIRIPLRGKVFHCWTSCGASTSQMEQRVMCEHCWAKCLKHERTMCGGAFKFVKRGAEAELDATKQSEYQEAAHQHRQRHGAGR